MLTFLAIVAGAVALAWSTRYYTDFIARDPYDFDRAPAWYAKLATMLLLVSPFLLLPAGAYVVNTILYNALLSFAVSALIVPAVFANRTGEGGTWLLNIAEKAGATSILAFLVSLLTAAVPTLWWYGVLVTLDAFSMWSRRLLLLISIQDKEKSTGWNEWRVRAMHTFISRATIAYWVLAVGLGALVQHSHVGTKSWNNGLEQLWKPVIATLSREA